ncbi:MAG: hypothetical protein ACN6OP_25565 [Pseudomonadales bacterium]
MQRDVDEIFQKLLAEQKICATMQGFADRSEVDQKDGLVIVFLVGL